MNELTDEQRQHVHEIVDGLIDGQQIQIQSPDGFVDLSSTDPYHHLPNIVRYPDRYRLKPKTITMRVYRVPWTDQYRSVSDSHDPWLRFLGSPWEDTGDTIEYEVKE